MKINEADFKHLPQGGKFASTLRGLTQLKEGESPFPLYNQLMQLISQTVARDSVPVLFPYLIGLAVENHDFSFVNFVVTMKLGFYHRGDLTQLLDGELRHYVAGIHNLKMNLPLKIQGDISSWKEEFRSLYVWNALLIHSYSPDILVLAKQGRFESAFKVKCPHCGNDIHSLYINAEDLSQNSAITPAPPPEEWDELFTDDVYALATALCENYEEKYFSKILPYVYGEYPCTVCGERSVVMDAMKAYQFVEEPIFVPDQGFLERLSNIAFALENPVEQWMFSQFVLGQYRGVQGLDSVEGMYFLLRVLRLLGDNVASKIHQEVMLQAEGVVERKPEPVILRSQLCHWLGVYYGLQSPQENHSREKAELYFRQAMSLMAEQVGREHMVYRESQQAYAIFLSHHSKEDKDKPLLTFYDSLDPEKEVMFQSRMEKVLEECYRTEGQYAQAMVFMDKILGRLSPEDSDYPLRLLEKGKLALMAEDVPLALACSEQAVSQYLLVLGAEYRLPSLLKGYPCGNKKLSKKAKEELGSTGEKACDALAVMGDIYRVTGQFAQALGEYEKAVQLWDWLFDVASLARGEQQLNIALCHRGLGEEKQAVLAVKKAKKQFEIRSKESKDPKELTLLQEKMKQAEEMSL